MGFGAWGRFWQALSASSLCRDGAGSTASTLHNSHALTLPQESHLFRGPPAHLSTPVPSARPGGCAGPTLTLPDCQAGQARQCGSAQGKGWSTPYHRPRWEPVLMTSRAPAAPQRRGGRRQAAMGAGPPPIPLQGGTGALTAHSPMSTCSWSEASQRLVNELGTKGREEGKKEKKRGLYHSCGPSCQGRLAHHQRGSDLLRQMMTHPLQAGQVLPAAGGEPPE